MSVNPVCRVALLLLLLAASASAQEATVSLPLQGRYRRGRCMPVRIDARGGQPGQPLTLAGDGALTAQINSGPSFSGVIPWLAIRTVSSPVWNFGAGPHALDLPLKPLEEDERLIGYVGVDPDVLGPSFPGQSLVRVPLDLADPLPGDVSAWEALDGLALDAAAASRLDEAKVRALLAGGTKIAIKSRRKPGGPWRWRPRGECWIAELELAGPTTAYLPEAYVATQSWPRGWPWEIRKQSLAVAAIFSLLLLAGLMAPRSYRFCAALLISVAAAALIALWIKRQSPLIHLSGRVVVEGNARRQCDRWSYFATLQPTELQIACDGQTRIVFGDRRQAISMNARQVLSPEGRAMKYRLSLVPRQQIAFQSRSVGPLGQTPGADTPGRSPLQPLAEALYARPGDRLRVIAPQEGETDAAVLIAQDAMKSAGQ